MPEAIAGIIGALLNIAYRGIVIAAAIKYLSL
jgi:hypothetical protein